MTLAELVALFHPFQRKWLQNPRQRHPRPLRAVEDRLDDVWGDQRETEDARHVGRRDSLSLGQFGDGKATAGAV